MTGHWKWSRNSFQTFWLIPHAARIWNITSKQLILLRLNNTTIGLYKNLFRYVDEINEYVSFENFSISYHFSWFFFIRVWLGDIHRASVSIATNWKRWIPRRKYWSAGAIFRINANKLEAYQCTSIRIRSNHLPTSLPPFYQQNLTKMC